MRAIGGLVAAALLLAACGSEAAVTTTAAPSTTVATTLAAEDSGVVPTGVAPCDLLTAAEVSAASGFEVSGVRDLPPLDCAYDLDTGSNIFIFVSIEDGMGRFGGAANLYEEYLKLVGDGETETIEGLGAGAVCCPFRTLAFDAGGGRFAAVGVSGTYAELAEPLEVLKALAEAMLGRL